MASADGSGTATTVASPRPRRFRPEKILRRPQSLFARTALTLAISASAITATAALAISAFMITPIAQRSADHEAALLVLSAQTWVELPAEARPWFELELAERHDLIIAHEPRQLPPVAERDSYLVLLEESLSRRLGIATPLREADGLVWADIPMGDHILQIGVDPSRTDTGPLYVGLMVVIAGAAIVLVTALVSVQRITGPLAATARAAKRFRGNETPAPLAEEGPKEFVSLAHSFNTMAREIAELMENRTTLLAGISHDLRTPIARMRLAVELLQDDVDPDLRARLTTNLTAMEELIRSALQYARGLGPEPRLSVDMCSALTGMVEDLSAGRVDVRWDGPNPAWVSLAPGALRRVLQNLIENGEQHGAGCVEVRGDVVGDSIVIHVLDRGDGIPAEERVHVFQPFYRLESSRNRRTGGSGLGLAIVSQLCASHGWNVDIDERDGGGSDVSVTVPWAGAGDQEEDAHTTSTVVTN